MLHPKDFEVNEAWNAFRIYTSPIRTEDEGDFHCVALMDAASCLILASELIPVTTARPIRLEFRHLVESAQRHKERLPVGPGGVGSALEFNERAGARNGLRQMARPIAQGSGLRDV